MAAGELERRVLATFENEAAPPADRIAPHPCAECDELAEDLKGRDPLNIPSDRLEYHRSDLPLLSAEAKRYFLPAWLIGSIDDTESDLTDALIMNLDSDHRQDGYSDSRKAVIRDYLDYIRARGDNIHPHCLASAEARWM